MVGGVLVAIAVAHPGADEVFAAQRGDEGCDAAAWLLRARALSAERRVDDGLAALQRARACGAEPTEVALARAALLASRDPARARAELDVVLAAVPGHQGARALRARLLAAVDPEAAVADVRALGASASVDDRLLAARLLRDLGRPDDALALVDDGPPAPALVAFAVDAELALGRPEAAAGRLDALPVAPWTDALRSRLPDLP